MLSSKTKTKNDQSMLCKKCGRAVFITEIESCDLDGKLKVSISHEEPNNEAEEILFENLILSKKELYDILTEIRKREPSYRN